MTLSYDETLLVTDDGRRLVFVPYTENDSGSTRSCGYRTCALYSGVCGSMFFCVSHLRGDAKNGYWKEAE